MEPSSRRHIYEFVCGEPFEKDGKFVTISVSLFCLIFKANKNLLVLGMEWCIIKIKGQSFMLHQIRKMIGMATAIVRY